MFKFPICAAAAIWLIASGDAFAQDALENEKIAQGAQAYRICAACHSLKPGVHLSGPSLAGLWGREASSIEDYGRYTQALEAQEFIWDETTLDAWLADPQKMVPGTTMTFRGVENDETREALIEFLRVAMTEDGYETVVEDNLVARDMADGQIPPDLSEVDDDQRVTEISHCAGAYYVTTADGAQFPFWETNVRLKIDTSERGPEQGDAVLLRSGMAGDRVSVVFSSLAHLRERLAEQC